MKAIIARRLKYKMLQLLIIILVMTISQVTLKASTLCASNGASQQYEYMTRFQLNGITTPTFGIGGYFDYSASSMTTLIAGTAYPIQADVHTIGGIWNEFVVVWLDLNQDGVIDNANERVYTSNADVDNFHTFAGNTNKIPYTAHNGEMVGRVIMQYSDSPLLCGTYEYGTTIDFKVTITGGISNYPLAINKNGVGIVNVTNVPAGSSFTPGTVVTLTAIAAEGSRFTGWTGDVTGTVNTVTVTMNSAKSVSFSAIPCGQVNQSDNQILSNGQSSSTTNFSTINLGGTTTYDWTNNNTSIGLAASGKGDISSFKAINNGKTPILASITVTPTFSIGSEGCAGKVMSFEIEVRPLPAVPKVKGLSTVCAGTKGVVYSTEAVMSSYNWTVPSGASIVSGSGTNTISIDFDKTAAKINTGIIKVSGIGDYGVATVSDNFTVTVQPVPTTPVITKEGHTLTSSANIGNQWFLDGYAVGAATGNQYFALNVGNYSVVVNMNGCYSVPSNSIIAQSIVIESLDAGVYPNPNQGNFNLRIATEKPVELSIEIINDLGKLIWKQEKVSVEGNSVIPLDINYVKAGIYFVILHNKDYRNTQKVVVMK